MNDPRAKFGTQSHPSCISNQFFHPQKIQSEIFYDNGTDLEISSVVPKTTRNITYYSRFTTFLFFLNKKHSFSFLELYNPNFILSQVFLWRKKKYFNQLLIVVINLSFGLLQTMNQPLLSRMTISFVFAKDKAAKAIKLLVPSGVALRSAVQWWQWSTQLGKLMKSSWWGWNWTENGINFCCSLRNTVSIKLFFLLFVGTKTCYSGFFRKSTSSFRKLIHTSKPPIDLSY